jgi:hypothetical protein
MICELIVTLEGRCNELTILGETGSCLLGFTRPFSRLLKSVSVELLLADLNSARDAGEDTVSIAHCGDAMLT